MGAATHLSFSVQPSSSFDSEVTLPQQPIVQALDAGNAVDTTYTGLVTLSVPLGNLVQRAGANAAVMNCVNGVATFTDITVSAGQACALVASASGLTSATSSTMTPTAVGGRDGLAELPRVTPDTTYPTITTTYTVGSGKTYSTIQAAINAAVAANANTHSEIVIDPGDYTEALSFGKKASGTGWIVLRPVTMPCAVGTRAMPSMFVGGVKLKAPVGYLNVGCANGAHHFRLVGLEIEGNFGTFLQFAQPTETSVANCPDFLGIDRCYIHGTSSLQSVRAIEYGAKSLFLVDSYCSEIHCSVGTNGDTQIIGGWSGVGPLLIENNYLEAAGEITMLGGSDTTFTDVSTADVTIRRNHFRKPLSWKGVWASKNLTELKTGQRVLYEGNVFENQWWDAQDCALTFGSAGQYGTAPWMGIRDLTVRKNIVRNASRALILNRWNQNTIGPITTGAPRGITTSTSGGSIAAATTYYYKITALFNTPGFSGVTPTSANASGVTYSTVESSDMMDGDSGSNEVHVTTGAGSTNSNTIVFRVTPGAIGFRIYRGTSASGESQYVQLGAQTPDGNGNATWTDTGALSWTAGTVPAGTPVKTVPVPMHRATVHDNLFIVNNTSPYDETAHATNASVQGVDDTQIYHNTVIADAETGWYLGAPASARSRFDYNIVSLRHYGAGGDIGGANVAAFFANEFPASVTKNLGLDTDTNFAPDISTYGGTWAGGPAATIGFANPALLTGSAPRTATFAQLIAAATLTSGSYANTTWTGDGKVVGADLTALASAIAGVVVTGEGTDLAGDTSGLSNPATQLLLSTQPAGAVSGVALTTQPVVTIADSGGSTVTSDTSTVTATLTVTSGTGSITAGGTKAAVAGVATFAGLTITGTGSGTITFTDGSLTAVTSASISWAAGVLPASKLLITTQPSGAVSGLALTQQPVVTVADNTGTTVTTDSSTVTASVLTGAGVTITGGATKAAVSGVASFAGLTLSAASTTSGVVLRFSDGVLTVADSAPFTVTATNAPPDFGITPGAPAQYRMARGRAIFAGFRRLVRAVWHWLTLSASLA